ncbi:FH1/FH2 domain-containing protein 3-like isoform X2 [Cherax quadricarinatus]|uniref:FH1/FH2 domain-containing protein 3-like isoform X2 n=1 Tax=Cherax quadricarinatus TaxID=27406 RepID=UPI00387E6B22
MASFSYNTASLLQNASLGSHIMFLMERRNKMTIARHFLDYCEKANKRIYASNWCGLHIHSRLLYITTDWKLLTTMLPTPEEKHKIQEATIFNPYLPLGSAEQFLMTLSSISELPARLKLWIFKLDSENMEKIGSITRASKVGFEELSNNIAKIEVDCKESWDHLKAITKRRLSSTANPGPFN